MEIDRLKKKSEKRFQSLLQFFFLKKKNEIRI